MTQNLSIKVRDQMNRPPVGRIVAQYRISGYIEGIAFNPIANTKIIDDKGMAFIRFPESLHGCEIKIKITGSGYKPAQAIKALEPGELCFTLLPLTQQQQFPQEVNFNPTEKPEYKRVVKKKCS